MSAPFQAKDPLVRDRQLKAQKLVIPFKITSNATPASVVLRSDEPGILFLRSEGVDQITSSAGAIDSGETASYTVSPSDASGIFNLLVKVSEPISKVLQAKVRVRTTGSDQPCFLGDADGISGNGNKIMLTCDSSINLSTTDLDGCLEVDYVVAE